MPHPAGKWLDWGKRRLDQPERVLADPHHSQEFVSVKTVGLLPFLSAIVYLICVIPP